MSKEFKYGYILLNQLLKGFDIEVLKFEVLFSSYMMVNKLMGFFMFLLFNFFEILVILMIIFVVYCLKILKLVLYYVNMIV